LRCGTECREKEGIDESDNNKCKVCTILGCSKCMFSEFSGIEVCTECSNPRFL